MTVTTPQPTTATTSQPRATIPASSPSLRVPRPGTTQTPAAETTPETAAGTAAGTAVEDAGWRELTDAVREVGLYPTGEQAERVTRTVLTALGGHVTGEERVALAQALPREAGRVIASQIPAAQALTAREFVESVAARIEGSTPATARWDVSSVLTVLADRIGEPLTARVLSQLPPGYALLFGRAELSPTA
ncbi:hypothetical protein GCM10010503_09730 [Streptomyces lucensis JCM 4490]|uniref:DUF2267 domain-containing protein n=1 Tax=Streptomyces lucensis JCM 4490 TaxID=1306176 RepID=A0A918IWS7_9ACTN|nr:DUF2267 domain-containing protein [Streptomyces lucensis]GGW35965.1 hypothetical protein GCM10010503_09730 [Streptomyces lucensis JCM 4490]